MTATPEQVEHYEEMAREAEDAPPMSDYERLAREHGYLIWTPVVDGERVTLWVESYDDDPDVMTTFGGERYAWKSAPCGLGCHCDAVAWRIR